MAPIDASAGEIQYAHHILPIWLALPDHLRGTFYISPALVPRLDPSIPFTSHRGRIPRSPNPILVASVGDYQIATDRRVIFLEHGAGQTYEGVEDRIAMAYSGGPRRDRVELFLCPSETVARRNSDAYPAAIAAVVGCAKLDRHHPPSPPPAPPTVALTFHADLRFVPEAASAFRHFAAVIPSLTDHFTLLGHAHPRLYRRVAHFYDRHNILHTPDLDTVLSTAHVMVADNTSAAFEFASLDRPLVWLSPPTYRRDVHHGLRFWDALILGEDVTDPADLAPAITRALSPVPPDLAARRRAFIDEVYAFRDGQATMRSVRAIEVWMEEREMATQ